MHIEVQVALNFVISYLYNKLPRRRVNIFGEELEKALKDKFRGHWYPDRPCRGSAFRCLKTGGPLDPVLERAARESGVPVRDVLEHLPRDLAVWVDPGETILPFSNTLFIKYLIQILSIFCNLYILTTHSRRRRSMVERSVRSACDRGS
jgi:hypothetical protein